ncbi:MAP7 domain-containing protein 1-like [Manihot esculenta]|uniref:MAP7 domain-containing protein 1-like n=1 Tax=Manihot esculenta TaxID=3983 RepID=UPI001CC7FCEB|nr:MAP7 domain-containing protein 1-like [Manihot esculenta]
MEKIKAPKNFTLSRESMNAALDALRAGRSVGETTQRAAKVISSRSAGRPAAPALVPSRASRPSSRGVRTSRPPRRSGSSSAPQSAQAPRSPQTSTAGTKKAPKVTARTTEGTELVRADSALPSGDVSEERLETSTTDERVPEGGMEIIPAGESVQGASVEVAPVIEEGEPGPINEVVSKGAVKGAGSKRPPPSKVPTPAPASKKSRTSKRPAPALPPLEKEKTYVVPLLSAPDNDIMNAEDITHQSPASVVVEILREQMFGGTTEASDPRLLALTGLLASSTREQVAFRSRTLEELGGTIREMLLMVDARDESTRSTVDRRIEEARLEENLTATNDARGHLAAAQEHMKTLREELAHTKEALEGANKRAAAAEVRRDEALEQLSSLEEAQKERDEAVSKGMRPGTNTSY